MRKTKIIASLMMAVMLSTTISEVCYCAERNHEKFESVEMDSYDNEASKQEKMIFELEDELVDIRMDNELTAEYKEFQLEQTLHDYSDLLNESGYESYVVNEENYESLEDSLDMDFNDMGLETECSYLISFDNGESAANDGIATCSTTGSEFTYTYNNKTYRMRYCTVTSADDSRYFQSSYCDVLKSSNKTLINNCLNTAVNAYISAVSYPLGIVSSICGLSVSDFGVGASSTLVLNCASTWTRVFTQVYSDYDNAWLSCSCVEYVKAASYMSGYYYSASSNSAVAVPTNEKSTTVYSSQYHNYAWRQKQAAIYAYNLSGCNYNLAGDVSYYYNGVEKVVHREYY